MTTAGRIVAVFLSVTTFVYLFVHDSWRPDNLFLVPDLVVCTALLAGAALPARRMAVPVMMIGFGLAAGVFATSVASYAVRDEFGAASLLGAVTSVTMAVLLARTSLTPAAPA